MPLVNGVQYKLSHVRLLYQVSERTTWSSFFQGTDYVAKKNGNQWFRPIGLTTFKEILHAREALYLSILTISWQFTFPVADSSAIAFSDCLCGSQVTLRLRGGASRRVAERCGWVGPGSRAGSRRATVGRDPSLPATSRRPPALEHRDRKHAGQSVPEFWEEERWKVEKERPDKMTSVKKLWGNS